MSRGRKTTTHKNIGKYPDQFNRTAKRTGKWRGQKAFEYIKYVKLKKQPEPEHRFESYRGYVSLNRQGDPVYTLIKRSGRNELILTKIYKRNKDKYTKIA